MPSILTAEIGKILQGWAAAASLYYNFNILIMLGSVALYIKPYGYTASYPRDDTGYNATAIILYQHTGTYVASTDSILAVIIIIPVTLLHHNYIIRLIAPPYLLEL